MFKILLRSTFINLKVVLACAVLIQILMSIILINAYGEVRVQRVSNEKASTIELKGHVNKGINEIIVDFSKARDVNPLIFGHNAMGYERCRTTLSKDCVTDDGRHSNWGTGLWNPFLKKPDSELLGLAKEIKIPILRFPGGSAANYYIWQETIGPIQDRPIFQFGLDEYLQLCETIGAEPLFTLNYVSDTDQVLADLVEYLNHPLKAGNPNGGINWAEERARNGHPEPYNVKYFEFGNEVYNGIKTRVVNVDPKVYAQRYLGCREKLKSIDPRIQLGAVLQDWFPGMTSWATIVAQTLRDSMDFGIVHIYPVYYNSDDGILSSDELFEIALAAPEQVKDSLETISDQLREYTGKSIPIAITEYNGMFRQNKPVPYRHCLGNALLNADLLRIFLITRAPILCANSLQISNDYWGMVYNTDYMKGKGKYYKRPNYFVFEMYAKHFGSQLIETQVSCPGYTSPAFENVQATTDEIQLVNTDAWEITSQTIDAKSWKVFPVLGVHVSKSVNEISVDFTGNKDINYHHAKVVQSIKPNHRYRLKGKMKAEELFSASGACLEVQDIRGLEKTHWVRSTYKVSGTTDWNNVMVEFAPLADAEAVKFIIRRVSGRGPVTGKVRVKDVVLEDLGPAAQYHPTPYLTAIASTNQNKDKLYLIVINKHSKSRMPVKIRIKDFPMSLQGTSWTLNGPAIDATNEDGPENVKISHGTFSLNPGKEDFEFIFEPHSLTALVIEKSM